MQSRVGILWFSLESVVHRAVRRRRRSSRRRRRRREGGTSDFIVFGELGRFQKLRLVLGWVGLGLCDCAIQFGVSFPGDCVYVVPNGCGGGLGDRCVSRFAVSDWIETVDWMRLSLLFCGILYRLHRFGLVQRERFVNICSGGVGLG